MCKRFKDILMIWIFLSLLVSDFFAGGIFR